MTNAKPTAIRLCDYKPTNYVFGHVNLSFDLYDDHTMVKTIISCGRNPKALSFVPQLKLHGEDLELLYIAIDGVPVADDVFSVDAQYLTINELPEEFTLETHVRIKPQQNTQLSGLYTSGGNFCTQCEAQGFRRITYFYDRPDVMTRFTTCISADKDKYPLLLSNGNLIEEQQLADNRHWVRWQDPSCKPCYLFALVAGDLEEIRDSYQTADGREVLLRLMVEKGFVDQADFAMQSLKRAMRWDEETYGRIYDLDVFMIVAVSDFNMGAMENKGLNIFNTKYVLAKQQTATDADFIAIEEVIGHEYFHNWTGNRITCRDWFQITLKEGLTVFRDQNFTMDMTSAGVKRIDDVQVMRNVQFLQDSGPMAHPIRPEEYIEINNFYTVTVYNKGAEVIRMMQTLVGKDNFRKGMDLYFSRHDETAVTTEDFVQAIADASGYDFDKFKRWYGQSGTPVLQCDDVYNSQDKTYTLSFSQSCPDTPGQKSSDKLPFVIPIKISLLNSSGEKIKLNSKDPALQKISEFEAVFALSAAQHSLVFDAVSQHPVPSLMRDFSAPVVYRYNYSALQDGLILQHDDNAFSRWDAAQRLMTSCILEAAQEYADNKTMQQPELLLKVMQGLLSQDNPDLQLLSRLCQLPSENYLLQQMPVADCDSVYAARRFVMQFLGNNLSSYWTDFYKLWNGDTPYQHNATAIGVRALALVSLSYLVAVEDESSTKALSYVVSQYDQANNMTMQFGALQVINDFDVAERALLLDKFYQQWSEQPLVMDKWFMLQASSKRSQCLCDVERLLQHPAYDASNPNKIRSLVGAFAANSLAFHAVDGSGYAFLSKQIILIDKNNPQIAARLCEPLTRWKMFDSARQQQMQKCLQDILDNPNCSRDVYEIAEKSLVNK